MAEQHSVGKEASKTGGIYKPFEVTAGLSDKVEEKKQDPFDLNNFTLTACDLGDEKTKAVYEQMIPKETTGHGKKKMKVVDYDDLPG